MRQTTAVVLALVSLFCGGCGGGASSSPTSPSEPVGPPAFTVAPIEPSALQYIVPIGNMGPWAHTFPTDHAYLYHHRGSGTFTPIPVLAPAAGTIENSYPGLNGEVKVWVRINSQFTYYVDYIVLAPGVSPGSRVEAGMVLGTSGGAALDFAVRDIGFNVGSRQLAFARDVRVPDRQRVSIGGFGITGLYGVPPDAPDFAAITPGSGQVVYRLLEAGEPAGPAGTRQVALLVTQLLEGRRLRVEVVRDQIATTAGFSSAATVYLR